MLRRRGLLDRLAGERQSVVVHLREGGGSFEGVLSAVHTDVVVLVAAKQLELTSDGEPIRHPLPGEVLLERGRIDFWQRTRL